jgi:hypothetical protein
MANLVVSLFATLLCSPVLSQEAVVVTFDDLGGATAEYHHRFAVHLTSDRGEELTFATDEVDVEILGSWKSLETRAVDDSGRIVASSTIKDADSWAKQGGQKLTFEQYPYTLGQLNEKVFKWSLDQTGANDVKPDFRVYRIRERTDIVNDLQMIWCAGIRPSFPEEPLKVGSTWTGESTVERPFFQLGARKKKFSMTVTSKYEVKKIKKKGKRQILEIEEEREFTYSGWVETVPFSVLVSGEGAGLAEWEFDATRGVVAKCEYRMNVNKPQLQAFGADDPVLGTTSNMQIVYDSELKKLK